MATLTLDEAKDHLNISSPNYDAELSEMIDAAEAVVVAQCGPLEESEVTDRVRVRGGALVLPRVPVASDALVSVALLDSDTPVTVGDLWVDAEAGVVHYASGALFTSGYYDVTYTAGRAVVPADLLLAVKEMLRHLWETQRGGSVRPGRAEDLPPEGTGYLIPNRVAELMEPHRLPPTVA